MVHHAGQSASATPSVQAVRLHVSMSHGRRLLALYSCQSLSAFTCDAMLALWSAGLLHVGPEERPSSSVACQLTAL